MDCDSCIYDFNTNVQVFIPPAFMPRGIKFSFFCLYVCSSVRTPVTFVEFASKFCKWCISQQLLISKHSYLDHIYLGGLALT